MMAMPTATALLAAHALPLPRPPQPGGRALWRLFLPAASARASSLPSSSAGRRLHHRAAWALGRWRRHSKGRWEVLGHGSCQPRPPAPRKSNCKPCASDVGGFDDVFACTFVIVGGTVLCSWRQIPPQLETELCQCLHFNPSDAFSSRCRTSSTTPRQRKPATTRLRCSGWQRRQLLDA